MLAVAALTRPLRNPTLPLHRTFSVFTAHSAKPLPPRPIIAETDITETFLKGTGPGGQKINKTSSAVQLKHIPTGIVVKCQGTRSREQNRRTARRLLGERLEEAEKGDEARTVVKRKEASEKKKSAEKKRRRKYRRLKEEKGKGDEGEAGAQEEPSTGSDENDAKVDESAQKGSFEQQRQP